MTKPITRPLTDYPILMTAALTFAGALVQWFFKRDNFGCLLALITTAIMLLSLSLHMFTRTSRRWHSVGLRHTPGLVAANMLFLTVFPANLLAILAVWAIISGWAFPTIAALWIGGSMFINIYGTAQLLRYSDWI